jgi:drug/metabolite transporter superfamily protein YnfA
MKSLKIIKLVGYFVLAGLFEIGGVIALIGVCLIMYWPRN